MLYAVIIAAGVGVIGLLYGLLERSKRQAADSKADTLSKSLLDQVQQNVENQERAARVLAVKMNEIARLNGELDALTKTSADVASRLNALLAGSVQAHPGRNEDRALPAVPAADLSTGGSG